MPRRARQTPGGYVYHVFNRAVARIRIFKHEKDFLAFEKTLQEGHQRTPVELLAYCIMPNHWHLVVCPRRDGELSAFMSWLTMTHAQRWRTSHGTVGYGPLYQGRFKAFAIQEDTHLLTVLRYVERNPVRAGLVGKAEDWRWSSLYRRLNGTVTEKAILAAWPVERRSDWLSWVNQPQTGAEEEALMVSIQKSRPFGSPHWQQLAAKKLNLSSSFRQAGRPWAEAKK